MSENNKNYWDDIEQQLKQIELERKLEKEAFAAQKSERKSRKKKPDALYSDQVPMEFIKKQSAKEEDVLIRQQLLETAAEKPKKMKKGTETETEPLKGQMEIKTGLDLLWDEELLKQEMEEDRLHISTRLDSAIDSLFHTVSKIREGVVNSVKNIVSAVKGNQGSAAGSTKAKNIALAAKKAGSSYETPNKRKDRKPVDPLLPFETQMEIRYGYLLADYADFKMVAKQKTAWVFEREEALSQKTAIMVQKTDIWTEKRLLQADRILDGGSNKLWEAKDYAENHKKVLLAGFAGFVVCSGLLALTISSLTAYEYSYNGKVLGIVKNQEDVYATIDIIGGKIGDSYDTAIEIDKEADIAFHKVRGMGLDIDSTDDILNRFTYMKDIKATAVGIFVDNEQVAILQNQEVAETVLQRIKDRFQIIDTESSYTKEAEFLESVRVREVETQLVDIEKEDEVLAYLLTGAVEKKIHLVEKGETFSGIASKYEMKQSELLDSNPDVIPDKLQIGQEIVLTQDVPLVTVRTVEVASYNAPIEYDIAYEDTSSMYEGDTVVKSMGINGEQAVVAEITRINGIEVERDIIEATVLSEPVSQVVLVGTKPVPALIGTGTFISPVRGRMTSGYGSRWGRMHNGVDWATSVGTSIYAADGGTVTFAGYKGSYGYLVIINHGGGRETYYAHCSKLHVKAGQKVYQGQHIANVGNTGNSTGPHLHFEVHINGVVKNPMGYL